METWLAVQYLTLLVGDMEAHAKAGASTRAIATVLERLDAAERCLQRIHQGQGLMADQVALQRELAQALEPWRAHQQAAEPIGSNGDGGA